MRDRFHAKDPRAMMLRFTTQTARSTLTAQQPENNIARAAVQALAAVIGGTQSLHTAGYGEPIAAQSEEAARTALRTQQIIAGESGVANTIDPFAGSYYLESLTGDLEQQAVALLDQIDAHGGILAATEIQRIRRELRSASSEQQHAVTSGEKIIVGVNRFVREDTPDPAESTTSADKSPKQADLERRQTEGVRALRARRDPARWQSSLNQLKDRARSGENLMPALIEAAENFATIGEISVSMREVFGEFPESVAV
jgi:methylmalonyl-CoA mutase N-terminal domain/subunit